MNETAERTEATAGQAQCSAHGARTVVSVAHDADEQARNLVGWRQTYDQLAAGRFVGTLTELPLDTMKVFRETTSHTLRQACEVRGDAWWFGIPVAREGEARIDAQAFGAQAFALRPGNVEFELLTPAQFSIYGVVVRGDVLRHYAATVERTALEERLTGAPVVQAAAACIERLCARLARCLDDGGQAHENVPVSPLSNVERNALQAEVLAALFDACAGLCEQLHVSRRTLQYCFQDVLGMAPATYLRALRLNGARRDLCGRAAGSVQDVAAAWGFWHLSQFATDYRRMFGMRPSEALRAVAMP
ncbi:helix-turn-helix domain-containing protein [Paraburkholderia nodosa]|uniref:helix-turn-helix domain-containing protein n=1 Tax=Paraburkholderia nodosa TaxID=392320 RepID=UPI000841A8D1